MKQIITITILAFSLLNCRAQSPIVSLEEWDGYEQQNAYYKDLNNLLNTFEGTWLYTNGNDTLKIVLIKSTMFNNGDYYEDIMIGGYQYIENGIEKINTLSDANNPNLGYSASIWGNTIHDNCNYLPVDDCVDGEKRIELAILDRVTNEHDGDLILHKRIINGQESLKARIEFGYSEATIQEGETVPDPTMPWQMHDIILIKQ